MDSDKALWSDGRGISDYDWGIFFILVTLDLCLLLIHRDLWNSQKWQILISVNRDLDFYFLRFVTRNPSPFKVFVYGKGVQNRSKFTNIFFFNFRLYFLGGIRLSCLPPNCHYHQISFALKLNRVRRSPVESGGLILVYMYIKWCIPVVLVVFYIFLIISNKINTK